MLKYKYFNKIIEKLNVFLKNNTILIRNKFEIYIYKSLMNTSIKFPENDEIANHKMKALELNAN